MIGRGCRVRFGVQLILSQMNSPRNQVHHCLTPSSSIVGRISQTPAASLSGAKATISFYQSNTDVRMALSVADDMWPAQFAGQDCEPAWFA